MKVRQEIVLIEGVAIEIKGQVGLLVEEPIVKGTKVTRTELLEQGEAKERDYDMIVVLVGEPQKKGYVSKKSRLLYYNGFSLKEISKLLSRIMNKEITERKVNEIIKRYERKLEKEDNN